MKEPEGIFFGDGFHPVPVQANIVTYPWESKWSSASYHCGLESHDLLVQDDDFLSGVVNWQELLCTDSELSVLLEEKNRTGRPFGTDEFYAIVEKLTGRDTRPGRPGRPMNKAENNNVSPDSHLEIFTIGI